MSSKVAFLLLFAAAFSFADPADTSESATGLHVNVLEGDGGVHHLPHPPSTAISIRVVDGNENPVQDVVLILELPEAGPSAIFADGTHVNARITNKSGEARFEVRPNKVPGHFEPRLSVNYYGHTDIISLKHENALDRDIHRDVYGQEPIGRTQSHRGLFGISKRVLLAISGAAKGTVVAILKAPGRHAPVPDYLPASSGDGTTVTPGTGCVSGQG